MSFIIENFQLQNIKVKFKPKVYYSQGIFSNIGYKIKIQLRLYCCEQPRLLIRKRLQGRKKIAEFINVQIISSVCF